METVTGNVTSGFETGAEFTLQYVITGYTGKPQLHQGCHRGDLHDLLLDLENTG